MAEIFSDDGYKAAREAIAKEIHDLAFKLNTIIRNAQKLGLEVRHSSYDMGTIDSGINIEHHEFTVFEEIRYGE